MFMASRRRRNEPDRFLDLKIALFLVGSVSGIIGMVRGSQTLITIALVIVAAGLLLRFLTRPGDELAAAPGADQDGSGSSRDDAQQ
ncbi:MAG TPA: hypothetical protein VMN60_09015 [Longimicrobiales bacterium]|nr:hypothetical protein [Longimicrobiales bacterium]